MATNFALDISNFVAHANQNIERLIRKTVFELWHKIDYASPVGDADYWKGRQRPDGTWTGVNPPPGYVGGRFRANWQYGNGTAPNGEIENPDPRGSATRSRIKSQIDSSPAFAVHYLVNNLPYAEAIENGHSWHQAPHGVVAVSIAEFPALVGRVAREVNT